MNRKEAIKVIEENRIYYRDWKQEEFDKALEKLNEPLTLADFLGWEEGVKYRWRGNFFKIEGNHLLHEGHSGKWVNMNLQAWELIDLRRATKAEKKLKAYHVKDEYSYNCLMKELEEQGYVWEQTRRKPSENNLWTNYEKETVIYCEKNKRLTYSDLTFYENSEKDVFNLIEYHKEEPKYYAKIKRTEIYMNNIDYTWGGFTTIEGRAIYMTKTDWNKLGINGSNVDFEKVEE